MTMRKTTIAALAAAGSLLAVSAQAAGPGMGGSLGECYNNWISHCNQHTAGYPNSCYTESLRKCDQAHKAAATQIPAVSLKAMKSASLRFAKKAPVKATFKPAR